MIPNIWYWANSGCSQSRDMAGDGGLSRVNRESKRESRLASTLRAIRPWALAFKNVFAICAVNIPAFATTKLVNLSAGNGARFACISDYNLPVAIHVAYFRRPFRGFHGKKILALRGAA